MTTIACAVWLVSSTFHHIDELLAFLHACRDQPPAEEYTRRKARFLDGIPA